MKKEIFFQWESEKSIRVAKVGSRKSLFYEAYRQALAGVTEIVRASIMHESDSSHDPFFPDKGNRERANEEADECELYGSYDRQYLYDYPSNVIVFSGERGAGKSSAMLSFIKGLENEQGALFKNEFLTDMVNCELPGVKYKMVDKMLQRCRFVALPPIDPTTLEDNGQILTVILARMFQSAISTWDEEHSNLKRKISAQRAERKDRLIQQFSTCYEHIQAIKRKRDVKIEYEGLDILEDLGDSSRLKVELAELVKQLLEFRFPEDGGFSYLVLQIDDTDMNIKQAYTMLEDIRRYLVIPRLIIIMAADLKHLLQVVKSNLLADYDKDLGPRQEYVDKITRQYITKLFSQTRQVNLPALGTYFKEHTENITIHYNTPGEPILPDEKADQFPDAQEQIFRLIYKKTGLVFLKQRNKLHPIIPGNMRLLAHFLSMLIQMESVENPDLETPQFFYRQQTATKTLDEHRSTLRTRLQNIQRFRNYFLTTWVTNSLNDTWAHLLSSLEQVDIADRVPYVCTQLRTLVLKDEDAGRYASTPEGSYADMNALFILISGASPDEGKRRLVFALRTYFSLLAHEVVLTDLIDYYNHWEVKPPKRPETPSNSEIDGSQYDEAVVDLGCSFSKLHMLFGSRLFFYPGSGTEAVKIQPPLSGTVQPQIDLRWSSDERDDVTSFMPGPKKDVVCLYSMLAEYHGTDGQRGYWLDLCNPIINCLYLGEEENMTPFLKTIFKDSKMPSLGTMFNDDTWHDMGNSALLTVLNSDIQLQMSDMIASEVNKFRMTKPTRTKTSYDAWFLGLKGFYGQLARSVKTSELSAIRCLDSICFDGWLNSLNSLEVKSWDEKGQKEWYGFIKKINKNITTPAVNTGKRTLENKIIEKAAEKVPPEETAEGKAEPRVTQKPSEAAIPAQSGKVTDKLNGAEAEEAMRQLSSGFGKSKT